jgi:hypothetical protein
LRVSIGISIISETLNGTHVKPRRLERLKTRARMTMGRNLDQRAPHWTYERLNFNIETIKRASQARG